MQEREEKLKVCKHVVVVEREKNKETENLHKQIYLSEQREERLNAESEIKGKERVCWMCFCVCVSSKRNGKMSMRRRAFAALKQNFHHFGSSDEPRLKLLTDFGICGFSVDCDFGESERDQAPSRVKLSSFRWLQCLDFKTEGQ